MMLRVLAINGTNKIMHSKHFDQQSPSNLFKNPYTSVSVQDNCEPTNIRFATLFARHRLDANPILSGILDFLFGLR